MIPQLAWPHSADQIRLWADLFLIWSFVCYVRNDNTLKLNAGMPSPSDGDRISIDLICSTIGGLLAALWAIRSNCPGILGGFVFLSSLLFPMLRRTLLRFRMVEFLPILELAAPVIVALLLGNLIGAKSAPRIAEFLQWPLSLSSRIAFPFYASAFLYITRAGTHFVKAVCATGKILPRLTASPNSTITNNQPIDQARLGMGRKLGNLERILMLIFVIAGRYDALGFVLAAKGLIRSKEFEDRDFTEYFLLGSLASILIALLTGELLLRVT